MGFPNKLNQFAKACVVATVIGLVGCGESAEETAEATTSISGSIFASYVAGASVTFYDQSGGVVAGPVTTDSNGRYSMTIPARYLDSALRVVSTGGTFTDEATGTADVTAGEMAAYVEAGSLSLNGEVHATPGSTIMHRLRHHHGVDKAAAESAFETAFGYLPDFSVAPVDASHADSTSRNSGMLAGIRAAGFSQLTSDLALTPAQQFALLQALAQDLSNGSLDGSDTSGVVVIPGAGSLPTDSGSRFSDATNSIRTGTKQGETYRFEYVPGAMAAMEGKSMFQVRVSDLATGTVPASGLSLSLNAKMYMSDKVHSTPIDGCVEDGSTGTYNCKIFYLMSSAMMDLHMGEWELIVSAGSEADTVKFYPNVGMGMNGNGKKKVSAPVTGSMVVDGLTVDTFSDYVMMQTKARPYYMFKNMISGTTDDRTVSLYAAVQESMMSFPALEVGQTYNTGMAYTMTAGSVSLEISSDGSSWTAMASDGNGYWSAASLSDAMASKFYVRLTVNGEVKTTNSAADNMGSCEDPDVVDNGVPLCNYYATFEQTL